MKKLACLVVVALTPMSVAEAEPRMVFQSSDWGVYSYVKDGTPACYALSAPKESAPSNVDHGENYFLIAPAEKGGGSEPEAMMGYDLKPGSQVEVSIGDQSFRMFVKDNTAWVSDPARAPVLINALRSGSRMTLEALSARGTRTTYTYSLTGVTAALQYVARCR